ncbi:hypothetical protein GYA27_00890 [candidate division WWE3 bacterium]|uniref:Uncharacterized protein n=1 Tax=candidate division WWE3 bacterium TaxID=2053526 RepID=A0A7X9DJQ3_UNCKA|nr:hypothetical protein [candidate division WWE3 bacterium]
MTKIQSTKTICYICGTEYEGNVVASTYSSLPQPNIKPLVCPKCGAPYKMHIGLQVGMAKEILLNILKSDEEAEKVLYSFVRTDKELNEWSDYLKKYATESNMDEWRRFDAQIKNTSKAEEISKIENLIKNNALNEAIDRITESTREKVKENMLKYKYE